MTERRCLRRQSGKGGSEMSPWKSGGDAKRVFCADDEEDEDEEAAMTKDTPLGARGGI